MRHSCRRLTPKLGLGCTNFFLERSICQGYIRDERPEVEKVQIQWLEDACALQSCAHALRRLHTFMARHACRRLVGFFPISQAF